MFKKKTKKHEPFDIICQLKMATVLKIKTKMYVFWYEHVFNLSKKLITTPTHTDKSAFQTIF